MHIYAVALATPFFYSYLNNLTYFIISYPNKIYLATTNEFIYQKLVEMRKSKDINLWLDVLCLILKILIP